MSKKGGICSRTVVWNLLTCALNLQTKNDFKLKADTAKLSSLVLVGQSFHIVYNPDVCLALSLAPSLSCWRARFPMNFPPLNTCRLIKIIYRSIKTYKKHFAFVHDEKMCIILYAAHFYFLIMSVSAHHHISLCQRSTMDEPFFPHKKVPNEFIKQ